MSAVTPGIHHVTAICGDAQHNVDFYAGALGLRLVKRTVNFDDPQTYHLYYGDETGRPGSLITFFSWPGAARGRAGPGQIAVTSFAVPPRALGFWIERLLRHGIPFRGPTARRLGDVDEQVLTFEDRDGLLLEIVATPFGGDGAGWDGAGVPGDVAIRGIHGVTLWEENDAPTVTTLVGLLGLEHIGGEETTRRYATGVAGSRSVVDVRTIGSFPRGNISVGTVHHVAWRVADDDAQLAVRDRLLAAGLDATPVIDRMYFHSVYFHEPGGVLFEIATEAPGFAVDEPPAELGQHLALPPWYEASRPMIERVLPAIHTPASAAAHYRDEESTA